MNRFLTCASAFALLTGAAYAQTTTPAEKMDPPRPSPMAPGSTTTAPGSAMPAPGSATAPGASTAVPGSSTTTTVQSGTAARPASSMASASDWRASKLIGTSVYNAANERIGDINEILIDNSGKISSIVVGVGGFLGMGEREVAVPFNELKVAMDGSTMRITSSYTKQSLTTMPEWRWNTTATTTTTTTRPATPAAPAAPAR